MKKQIKYFVEYIFEEDIKNSLLIKKAKNGKFYEFCDYEYKWKKHRPLPNYELKEIALEDFLKNSSNEHESDFEYNVAIQERVVKVNFYEEILND